MEESCGGIREIIGGCSIRCNDRLKSPRPKLTLESTRKTTLQVEHTIACLEGLLVDCRCASDLDAHNCRFGWKCLPRYLVALQSACTYPLWLSSRQVIANNRLTRFFASGCYRNTLTLAVRGVDKSYTANRAGEAHDAISLSCVSGAAESAE